VPGPGRNRRCVVQGQSPDEFGGGVLTFARALNVIPVELWIRIIPTHCTLRLRATSKRVLAFLQKVRPPVAIAARRSDKAFEKRLARVGWAALLGMQAWCRLVALDLSSSRLVSPPSQAQMRQLLSSCSSLTRLTLDNCELSKLGDQLLAEEALLVEAAVALPPQRISSLPDQSFFSLKRFAKVWQVPQVFSVGWFSTRKATTQGWLGSLRHLSLRNNKVSPPWMICRPPRRRECPLRACFGSCVVCLFLSVSVSVSMLCG